MDDNLHDLVHEEARHDRFNDDPRSDPYEPDCGPLTRQRGHSLPSGVLSPQNGLGEPTDDPF